MVKSIKEILKARSAKGRPKNIAHEFQDFGVRLAQSLGDLKRKSLYIKLAKEFDRKVLEKARDFALGYHKPRSKAKVFMWMLKELSAGGSAGWKDAKSPSH